MINYSYVVYGNLYRRYYFFYAYIMITYTDQITFTYYLTGVILGGSLCSVLFPNAFEDWTGVPLSRIVIGGLLVGFGTRLGNFFCHSISSSLPLLFLLLHS